MRGVVNHEVQRPVKFRRADGVQPRRVRLVHAPEGADFVRKIFGLEIARKIRAVLALSDVHGDVFARLEGVEPERHAAAVPDAQFENTLRAEVRAGLKKPFIFADQSLDFVKVETLGAQLPVVVPAVFNAIHPAAGNHPVGLPFEVGEQGFWCGWMGHNFFRQFRGRFGWWSRPPGSDRRGGGGNGCGLELKAHKPEREFARVGCARAERG